MNNIQTEHTPRRCFRCGYEDHLIEKCTNQPRDNGKRRKQVHLNEKGNRACDNGGDNSDQKIHAYMARMNGNDECLSGNVGDSLQLTNWILDSGATCHMTPEVSDFIPGSLEDTDKHVQQGPAQDVTFLYTRYHLSELQSCPLIFLSQFLFYFHV